MTSFRGSTEPPLSSSDDPWHWTVQDVVTALCSQDGLLRSTGDPLSLPDPVFLERALRENAISGSALLTGLDQISLRDELGLKPLGHRMTIVHFIRDLRRRSPQYLNYCQTDPAYIHPLVYAEVTANQKSEFLASCLGLPSHQTPQPAYVSPYRITQPPRVASPESLVQTLQGRDVAISDSVETNLKTASAASLENAVAAKERHPSAVSRTPGARQGETQIIDELGRKRRRLILTVNAKADTQRPSSPECPVALLSSQERADVRHVKDHAVAELSEDVLPYEADGRVIASQLHESIESEGTLVALSKESLEHGSLILDSHGRKRMIPITIPQDDYDRDKKVGHRLVPNGFASTSQASLLSESPKPENDMMRSVTQIPRKPSQQYLGPKSLAVDAIFYGNTAVGQEVNDVAQYSECWRSNDPPGSECFALSSSFCAPGQRQYVADRFRHYLSSKSSRLIERQGHGIIVPYPSFLAKKHQPLSVTVFSKEPNRVIASKGDRSEWLREDFQENKVSSNESFQVPKTPSTRAQDSNTEWDYLKKWDLKTENDEILPVYGDSGSEGAYDAVTLREIEKEHRKSQGVKKKLKDRKLSEGDVNEAIQAAEKGFVEQWHRTKEPKLLPKAWRIWRKPKSQQGRQTYIRSLTQMVKHLEVRLLNITKEILREDWSSTKEVAKQCQSMQESIFQRQHCKWKISILALREAPKKLRLNSSRPAINAAAISKSPPHDSGHELRSDVTLIESENDSLNDFIVDHDSDESTVDGMNEEDDYSRTPSVLHDYDKRRSDASESENNSRSFSKPIINQDASKDQKPYASAPATEHEPLDIGAVTESSSSFESLRTVVSLHPSVTNKTSTFDSSHRIKSETPGAQAPTTQKKPVLGLPLAVTFQSKDKFVGHHEIIDLTQQTDSGDEEIPLASRASLSSVRTPVPRATDEAGLSGNSKWPTAFKTPPGITDLLDPVDDSTKPMITPESKIPDLGEVSKISELNPDLLVERNDRKRLLIWVVAHTPHKPRDRIIRAIKLASFTDMQSYVWDALKTYQENCLTMTSLNQEHSDVWMRVAAWYVCWTIPVKIDSSGIAMKNIQVALKRTTNFPLFVEFLRDCLAFYESGNLGNLDKRHSMKKKKKKKKPKNRILHEDSDENMLTTPHKRRKFAVPESQETVNLRGNAQERVHARNVRQAQLKRRFREMGVNEEDPSRIVVNTGKLDDQNFVYLNPKIGKCIQPHQVEGVRFLWREVVAGSQGCLLAQTMGLGKTMQVISLLVTITEAATSPDENIRNQVPLDLRESRTLILCPPGLIENWWDEFLIWTPPNSGIGELRKVTSSIKLDDRCWEIREWGKEGGILLMGFTIFRDLIQNKMRKGDRPLSDEQHAIILDVLLNQPNIVVADEAHAAKNLGSGINLTVNRLKSKARIALTGSPLANNLEEFYSLIDWIAPNFLGTRVEFKANYEERIQAGLWQDSTPSQYRSSLKLLEVLKQELAPKVHRADISVLHESLKEKQEFVIRVPLTPLQEQIYRIYVDTMTSISSEKQHKSMSTAWAWLSTLRLVCNHPLCFRDKLLANGSEGRERRKKGRDLDGRDHYSIDEDDALVDAPVSEIGISQIIAEQQLTPFRALTGDEALESISFSNKMQILMDIVRYSKDVGDKVLVFSHTLDTLNYVEKQMVATGTKYSRIDGKVPTADRQHITKQFNSKDIQVCLISTRAGGQGLNLFGANRVVIVDDHFNPMYEEQAVGRAYRIGQTKAVFVYHLMVGGTFEEMIHNQSVFKQQLAKRVVDKKNPARRALKGIGEYLLPPRKVPQQDLEPFSRKDPLVLDRILATQSE